MAYRHFSHFEEAARQGFMNAYALSHLDGIERDETAQRKKTGFFVHAGKALLLQYLNMPPDSDFIVFGQERVTSAACAFVASQKDIGEALFTRDALTTLNVLVSRLEQWGHHPFASAHSKTSFPIDVGFFPHSYPKGYEFRGLSSTLISNFLKGDDQFFNCDLRSDFFIGDNGHLHTLLHLDKLRRLNLEWTESRFFYPFSMRGQHGYGAVRKLMELAFQRRESMSFKVNEIEFLADDFHYDHSISGSIEFYFHRETEDKIRAVRNTQAVLKRLKNSAPPRTVRELATQKFRNLQKSIP